MHMFRIEVYFKMILFHLSICRIANSEIPASNTEHNPVILQLIFPLCQIFAEHAVWFIQL